MIIKTTKEFSKTWQLDQEILMHQHKNTNRGKKKFLSKCCFHQGNQKQHRLPANKIQHLGLHITRQLTTTDLTLHK